ncbi:MAG: hypothetical protein ACRCYZ_05070, partial [Alphaproteobacteria bacterium]
TTDRAVFVCLSGNNAWYHAGGSRQRYVCPVVKKTKEGVKLIPIVGGNSAKKVMTVYCSLNRLICLLRGHDLNGKKVIHKNGDPTNNAESNILIASYADAVKYHHKGRTSRFIGVFYRKHDTRRGYYWVSSVNGSVKYFDEEITAALDALDRFSKVGKQGIEKYLEPFSTDEMNQYGLWRYIL